MVDEIKAYAEKTISDHDLEVAHFQYKAPIRKSLSLYRRIFEKFYPGRALIKDYWLPNQSWSNCEVKDPSARVLPNYGKSGK